MRFNCSLRAVVIAATAVLCGSGLYADEMSLSSARAKIGTAISNPTELTALFKQLSPTNQCSFLAEVNAAIDKMPGSTEAKTAMYLNASTSALKGAAATKGDVAAVLSEIFATVPPEALTVVNEQLAKDMFNRTADPNVSYTDEQYEKISSLMMDRVNARVKTADNGDVRSAFALLMLVRASNGTPANLTQTLTGKLPENVREVASEEWFPAALGQNGDKTYEPMLAYVDGGKAPDPGVTIRIAGPQTLTSMLGELVEGSPISRVVHDITLRGQTFGGTGDSVTIPADPGRRSDEPSRYHFQD